jgi:integral membrane sensor domain MASE1
MPSKISVAWRTWAAITALAAVYFLAGKLALSLAVVHPSASAIWPPSGVALAALLLWGSRLWPGVFIGAFLVNITTEGNLLTTLAIASGNTLEPFCGAWFVNQFANGAKFFYRAETRSILFFLRRLLALPLAQQSGPAV